jgi:hypothetical protein
MNLGAGVPGEGDRRGGGATAPAHHTLIDGANSGEEIVLAAISANCHIRKWQTTRTGKAAVPMT